MSPRNGLASVLILPVYAATLIAARELPVRHLLQAEACTDLSIKTNGLGSSTEAALAAIAAAFANVSDRYARDYDANLTTQGPVPFQIPGSPVRSPCDFSTKAQECSGIMDRQLHPATSPAGPPATNLNTYLPLSLRQPEGVMLMHPTTGACATMEEGNWTAFPNVTPSRCLFQKTQPTLPQPQYWRLSNHSITSVVSANQPGYAWTSEARSGALVSGAFPSGMPFQQNWLVLPLPAPVSACATADQASPPSCGVVPFPVMIIREPAAPGQVVLCASGSENVTGLDGMSPAGAASLPSTLNAAQRSAVTTAPCQPTDRNQIWQVMDISGSPEDLTAVGTNCALPLAAAAPASKVLASGG